jgi:hypothetical protein
MGLNVYLIRFVTVVLNEPFRDCVGVRTDGVRMMLNVVLAFARLSGRAKLTIVPYRRQSLRWWI